MAQIIKHRRGQLSGVKSLTARNAEFIIASGSISDLNGPFVFIGSPNGTDEGVAGAFKSVSTIYQGTAAPTITAGSYGSILDGTPFYASGNESLYILNNDGAGGNTRLDLTGNIEGNLISGVTINNITGTTANIRHISGSFTGSGIGLYDIPASGITGLELNRISSGAATASISEANGLRINTKTEITGALIVTSDITGSNLYLSGNAKIDGNITLGGNITVGNSTTDFVTFGADISSSIVPDIHNAFDLGSSSQNWRNLHVSGTAYVDTLQARQVNFTDLGILEDLTVSGSTFLGNGGDITVISGSLYNDQLTEKRMVVVGSQGLLTNYSGLTFDNGNLNLSGALEVTNIQGTGSLYLKPDLDDSRLFEIYNSAGPSGYTDIHFVGNADLNFFGDDTNYLKIDDYAQTATLVGVNGVIVSSSLQVTGSVFTDKILGTGSLYLQPNQIDGRYFEIYNTGASDVHIKSSNGLSFFGDDTNYLKIDDFAQTATIVGANGVFISSSLSVTGSGTFTNNLNVSGDTTTVGSQYINSNLFVGGNGKVTGSFEVVGATSLDSTLTVTGSVTLKNNLSVSGTTTIDGLTTINDSAVVNGVLTVTGNTQLQSNLYVSGNLEVLGSSTSVNLQSNTVNIGDNIILVNAYSPFQRYAGISGYDSGSVGASGSLLWDSQNDYWMLVSGSGESSKVIGTTAGTYGSETSLTSGTFPIASGNNTIGNSLLTYSGTTLAFNNNKFTIDSGNGNTMVSGNFTLSYSGGTDNGTKTSAILFRNSSNVVGFVTTTETTDVMDGILGYKQSGGGLVFSTVIDGGTY
jgi:cytoskeletal protein CcmA (bactofilin family)